MQAGSLHDDNARNHLRPTIKRSKLPTEIYHPFFAGPAKMSASATLDAPVQAPPPATAPEAYFQKSVPVNLILGTFFCVSLPLAAYIWLSPSNLLLWGYLWLFGMTHFVLTFTVYLNRGNLAHFGSTWSNRLIYFALPVLIFVGFDLIHVLHVREAFPIFALYFFAVVRLTDFNHFTRQSFGVLQMFKAAAGERYPKRVKILESWSFKVGTLLMLTTFLAGGVSPLLQSGGPLTLYALNWSLGDPLAPVPILQAAALVLTLVFVGLLTCIVVCHRRTRTAVDAVWIDKPVAYLLFLSLGTMLAAFAFPFYGATLAIHYIEYQVLMYPRCFHSPLDPSSRLDRFYGRLRSNPLNFYVVMVLVAGVASLCCFGGMGFSGMTTMDLSKPAEYVVLIALFDGLFVFHYLIEAFIWRFSEPYYRKSLSGLYFKPAIAQPKRD